MLPNNPAQAYQSAAIENAPPLKVIRMLYAGALRFLGQAKEAHAARNLHEFNHYVGRAEAIVSELRGSLDHSHSKALADQLEGLYLFAFARMIDAIADSAVEPLEDAINVLEVLLDAWNQLEIAQAS